MTDSVTYSGTKYRLPFAGLLRPLTKFERLDLLKSLKEDGPLSPVLLYDPEDGKGPAVVDGANRLALCAGNSITGLAFVNLGTLSEEQARRRAIDSNLARRQLTPEEQAEARKERVARVVHAHASGQSLRTIADREGVSREQVRRDIQDAEKKGVPPGTVDPHSERHVLGADGKTYRVAPSANGTHAPDDGHQPAGVLASGGSADECRSAVEQMHRELARFQERLSGLMAGEFAAQVKEAAEGNAFRLWTDGELQGGQAWGSVRYGVAKYACDPLDALLGFVGTLKVVFDRARSAPAGGRDTDDPYTLGKELRDPDIEF